MDTPFLLGGGGWVEWGDWGDWGVGQSKSPMRSILLQKAELNEGILYQSKNAFKEVVATLSKKNEMGAYRSM
jgi:hypothetical protein